MVRFCEIRNASGAIFSRDAYLQISKKFLDYKNCGDMQFWIEILSQGTCAKVGKNLTYFRQNDFSITGINDKKGIVQIETKYICDYVDDTYHLSSWQKRQMLIKKARTYPNMIYESEEIRQNVLSTWNINNIDGFSWGNSFLCWLSGALERHFRILI